MPARRAALYLSARHVKGTFTSTARPPVLERAAAGRLSTESSPSARPPRRDLDDVAAPRRSSDGITSIRRNCHLHLMMLPRKRQRHNPAAASTASLPTTAVSPHVATSQAATSAASEPGLGQQHHQPHMPRPLPSGHSTASNPEAGHQREVRKTKSWYGSWPRTPNKASASTSVARENILGGTVRSKGTPDLSRFDPKKGDDAASLRSIHAPSLSKVPEDAPPQPRTNDSAAANDEPKQEDQPESNPTAADKRDGNQEVPEQQGAAPAATPERPPTTGSWLGWWSRTPNTASEAEMAKPPPPPPPEDTADEGRPSTPPAQTAAEQPPADPPKSEPPPPSSSWFGFLGNSSNAPSVKQDSAPKEATAKEPEDVVMDDAPPPPPKSEPEPAPKAGSTWAFWSRDSPKKDGKVPDPESGEIAVMGEGSEAHPTPMAEGDVSSPPAKPSKTEVKAKEGKSTWRRSKRARPASMDTDSQTPTPPNGTVADKAAAEPAIQPQTETKAPAKVDTAKAVAESESTSKFPPNLLLPSFSSTYQMKEDPSIIQQIKSFLLRTSQPPANHVFRVKEPPKIRKAIAIGVHGLFPATYLRPMIGQPTGTSLRFASLCADAIRRWADAHGCGEGCEIEKVALEGEGRISDRVDNLWKLLLNWIEHIRAADLILVASHSQGVPVSVMLLEKLIDLGIVTNARIGVCAMAGVALGPFPDYKSSILMGSAAELWDFGNPSSANSQRFEAAMRRVLAYGARITFIGSIDDQLVPMESAVYSPASHPYIYRAVFIDGRVHAPDFIAHLVGFALKLRNLGVSDHGLVRELSAPLAGSLYSGEGHSRLYYDAAVYDLAVSHALETTSVPPGTPCEVRRLTAAAAGASSSASSVKGGAGAAATAGGGGTGGGNATTLLASPNPYVLPWIMRGVLEEDFVRTELHAETEELLRKFDDWKPANKALKDVKYRLEAVRSKL